MRIPIKLVLFLVALLVMINAQAQNVKSIEDRVKLLEDYNERVLQQQFEAQEKALSTKVTFELDKAKEEIKDQLRVFQITSGIFALVIAAGIGGFVVLYLKKIPKVAEEALNKKLESHLDEKTSQILELLTSQSTENKIRASKKIFVVAGSDAELSKTLKLLKDMKFVNVEGEVYRYYQPVPSNDLLVFSAQDRALPEELITEFLSKGGANDTYVYFGPGRITIDQTASYAEQINFANSKYTLYNQLFTVLVFNHLTRS